MASYFSSSGQSRKVITDSTGNRALMRSIGRSPLKYLVSRMISLFLGSPMDALSMTSMIVQMSTSGSLAAFLMASATASAGYWATLSPSPLLSMLRRRLTSSEFLGRNRPENRLCLMAGFLVRSSVRLAGLLARSSQIWSIMSFSLMKTWDWLVMLRFSSSIFLQSRKISGWEGSSTGSSSFISSSSFFFFFSSFSRISLSFLLKRSLRATFRLLFSFSAFTRLRVAMNFSFAELDLLLRNRSSTKSTFEVFTASRLSFSSSRSMASRRIPVMYSLSSESQSVSQRSGRWEMQSSSWTRKMLVTFSRLQEMPKMCVKPTLGFDSPITRKKQLQYSSSVLEDSSKAIFHKSSSWQEQEPRASEQRKLSSMMMESSLFHITSTPSSNLFSSSCLMQYSSEELQFWTKNSIMRRPRSRSSGNSCPKDLRKASERREKPTCTSGMLIMQMMTSMTSGYRFSSSSLWAYTSQKLTYSSFRQCTSCVSLSAISSCTQMFWKVLKSSLSMYLTIRSYMNRVRLCSFHWWQIVWMSQGGTSSSQLSKMSTSSSLASSLILRGLISSSMLRMLMICSLVSSSKMICSSRQMVSRARRISSSIKSLRLMSRASRALSSDRMSLITSNSFHRISSSPYKISSSKVLVEQYTVSCRQISTVSMLRGESRLTFSSSITTDRHSLSSVASSVSRPSKNLSSSSLNTWLFSSMLSSSSQVFFSSPKHLKISWHRFSCLMRLILRARFLDRATLSIRVGRLSSQPSLSRIDRLSLISTFMQSPVISSSMRSWFSSWKVRPLAMISFMRISSSMREQFSDCTKRSSTSLNSFLSVQRSLNSLKMCSLRCLFSRKKRATRFSGLRRVREEISSFSRGMISCLSMKQCMEAQSLQSWMAGSFSLFLISRVLTISGQMGSLPPSIASSFENWQMSRYSWMPFNSDSFCAYSSRSRTISPCFHRLFSRPYIELQNSSTVSRILLVGQSLYSFLRIRSLVSSVCHSTTVTSWNQRGWSLWLALGSLMMSSLVLRGFCTSIWKGQLGRRKLKVLRTSGSFLGNLLRNSMRNSLQFSRMMTLNSWKTFSRDLSSRQGSWSTMAWRGSMMIWRGSSSSLTMSSNRLRRLEEQILSKMRWSIFLFISLSLSLRSRKSFFTYSFRLLWFKSLFRLSSMIPPTFSRIFSISLTDIVRRRSSDFSSFFIDPTSLHGIRNLQMSLFVFLLVDHSFTQKSFRGMPRFCAMSWITSSGSLLDLLARASTFSMGSILTRVQRVRVAPLRNTKMRVYSFLSRMGQISLKSCSRPTRSSGNSMMSQMREAHLGSANWMTLSSRSLDPMELTMPLLPSFTLYPFIISAIVSRNMYLSNFFFSTTIYRGICRQQQSPTPLIVKSPQYSRLTDSTQQSAFSSRTNSPSRVRTSSLIFSLMLTCFSPCSTVLEVVVQKMTILASCSSSADPVIQVPRIISCSPTRNSEGMIKRGLSSPCERQQWQKLRLSITMHSFSLIQFMPMMRSCLMKFFSTSAISLTSKTSRANPFLASSKMGTSPRSCTNFGSQVEADRTSKVRLRVWISFVSSTLVSSWMLYRYRQTICWRATRMAEFRMGIAMMRD